MVVRCWRVGGICSVVGGRRRRGRRSRGLVAHQGRILVLKLDLKKKWFQYFWIESLEILFSVAERGARKKSNFFLLAFFFIDLRYCLPIRSVFCRFFAIYLASFLFHFVLQVFLDFLSFFSRFFIFLCIFYIFFNFLSFFALVFSQ